MPIFVCNHCKDSGKVGWPWSRRPCPECMEVKPKVRRDNSNNTNMHDLPKASSGTRMPLVKSPKIDMTNPEKSAFIQMIENIRPSGTSGYSGTSGTSGFMPRPPKIKTNILFNPMNNMHTLQINYDNHVPKVLPKAILIDIPDFQYQRSKISIDEFKGMMAVVETKIRPHISDPTHVMAIIQDVCRSYSYDINTGGAPQPPEPPEPRRMKF